MDPKAYLYKYKNINNTFVFLPVLYFVWFLLFFHLRFDVEKECLKIDEDYKEKTVIDKSHLSKIETRIDTAGNWRKNNNLVVFKVFEL